MRLRLVGGRLFTRRDGTGAPRVLVVNESFAHARCSAGAPAVGQRVAARRRGLRVQAPRTFRPCSRNLTLRADVPVDERLRTRFYRDTRTILAGHRRREEPEPFVVGEFAIDYGRRRVTVGGAPVKLTATEYRR